MGVAYPALRWVKCPERTQYEESLYEKGTTMDDKQFRVLDEVSAVSGEYGTPSYQKITWQARENFDGTFEVWIFDPRPRKLHNSLNAEHAEIDARTYADVAVASFGMALASSGRN